jgi:hypothetical protein
MSINWSIESHNNMFFVRVVYEPEPPNLQMWIQTIQEIIKDEHYHPGMGFILDRRGVSEVASPEEVKAALDYIKYHQQIFKGSRWGVLQGNMASYGMARMGQILSVGMPIEVDIFDDLEQAKDWLTSKTDNTIGPFSNAGS